MPPKLAILACMVLTLFGAARDAAYAAQLLDVQVMQQDGRFRIGMHVVIDAAATDAFMALQDYGAMARYNPDLRSVVIERSVDPRHVRLATTVHTCVLFFCKTMHQRQVMTANADARGGVLRAQLLPEGSAFSGEGRWTVRPCGVNPAPACLEVQIELRPQFWLAPVIGSWVIRRKMYEEAQLTSRGLEQLAQARARARGTAAAQ